MTITISISISISISITITISILKARIKIFYMINTQIASFEICAIITREYGI